MIRRFHWGWRFRCWANWPVAWVVVLACVCLAAGQGPASKTAKGPSEPAAGAEERPPLSVPGFWALSMPPVQKELWLTDEQRQQLQAVAAHCQAKGAGDLGGAAKAVAGGTAKAAPCPPPAGPQRPGSRPQGRGQRAHSAAVAVVRDDRLPSARAGAALEDAHLLATLNLTDAQRAKLGQIRDNLEERLHRVQNEAADKTLDILTAEQQQKLKEQFTAQGW